MKRVRTYHNRSVVTADSSWMSNSFSCACRVEIEHKVAAHKLSKGKSRNQLLCLAAKQTTVLDIIFGELLKQHHCV